jgi:hypothetical protein
MRLIMKECFFKGPNCTGVASSKEHVIHNSRRRMLREKGADLGNLQARFKGISCANCNEFMGRKEEYDRPSLAISTVWKVVIGNLNNVFNRADWAQTKHAKDEDLAEHANFLRDAFVGNGVFPNEMLGFDIEYTVKPVEKLNVLLYTEGIIIKEESISFEDLTTRDKTEASIDLIIYKSFDNNSQRILLFYPLIPVELGKKVKSGLTKISHRGFGTICSELFDSEQVKYKLYPLFSD